MTPTSVEELTAPGTPEVVEAVPVYEFDEIFLIQYKDGSHIVERNFGLRAKEGETPKEHLKRAINRAFQFCERCRYRFIHCQPFIMDLDEIEKKFSL